MPGSGLRNASTRNRLTASAWLRDPSDSLSAWSVFARASSASASARFVAASACLARMAEYVLTAVPPIRSDATSPAVAITVRCRRANLLNL